MSTLEEARGTAGRLSDLLDLPASSLAFRDEVRAWVRKNATDEARAIPADRHRHAAHRDAVRRWTDAMREAGYLCVSWPQEYGGRGLSSIDVALLNEEFAAAGVPRITLGMGETLVGPSIIVHGTDEQKTRLLPRIVSGQDRYCQGFSEPGSGSDLASLRTRGAVEGDEVVINGQKVWTSWYTDATVLFCLCRTNPDAPQHRGISYVLVPIRRDGQPNGVEFRPLRQMTGQSHFAETFLTDARAPLENVIGGLDNGWKVAMTTLGNERGGTATTRYVAFREELLDLVVECRQRGLLDDPVVRDKLAWAWSQVEVMRFQALDLLASLAVGEQTGSAGAGSVNKMFWSEYQRRLGEIAIELLGPDGLLVGDGYHLGPWSQLFLTSRSHTIWGGTAEIQRNIIGERILGLPREPRLSGSRP